ncbi:MAG: hypothetical protein ACYC1Z_11085 [Georgenia sp.]
MIRRLTAVLAWFRPTAARSPATPKPPAETPAAPVSPYAAANGRIRDAAKWMAAAIAAVATVLVGTSPLSGIGRLSAAEPGRLYLAIGAIVVGLAAALVAIFLLSRIQLPQTVLAADIVAMAADPTSAVAREAVHEPFLTAGRANLAAMLEDYAQVQKAYYEAVGALTAAEREVLEADSERKRQAARSKVDAAKERVAFEEARDGRLAPAVGYATDLAIHQKLRGRAGGSLASIMVLSVLAGMSFVVFAWAANPPEGAAADVLAARPSAGVLQGDDDDRESFARQLGAACATRIVEGEGAAVLALAASDGNLEVVIVPDDVCTEAARLTVPADRVVPAGSVR